MRPHNLLQLTLFALLAAPALAQTPQLEPIQTPPQLTPVPVHTTTRALHPAPDTWQTQWPAATFDAAFQGTAVFFRVGPSHEILHITVDGNAPLILKAPAQGTYRVSGLTDSRHTIRIQTATESQDAPNTFGGFGVPAGEKPLPAPTQTRQIEFIGDSHTVGYGNTSPTRTCTPEQIWADTDSTQSFTTLLANQFHADFQVNAISGRGIVRNYNGFAGDTLPEAYPYVLLNNRQNRYRDPNWHPEVIVIALGTNDFSTPLNPNEKWKTRNDLHADYEATYLRFLHDLRAKNPKSWILLWATGMANGEIESEVQKVTDQAKAQGETRLTFLPINHLAFTACNAHPSLADDRTIQTTLAQWIDTHPEVWQPGGQH